MRADLVALGVRLGWVAADEKEEPALAAVMERLRHEGEGILLIYDNAVDAGSLKRFLPRGGNARVLVTSNAHAWRGVASPVEIRLWPKEIGADYLVARTGREAEREAAEALSEALGGLPLAHEQAAAYCERLGVPLAEYAKRFEAAPAKLLDTPRCAGRISRRVDGGENVCACHRRGREAAPRRRAADRACRAAGAGADPAVPLSEGREKFGERLAALLAEDGLDEAVAALRTFALMDRETIADEREPEITTECIRLHRLVRQVAAARLAGEARRQASGRCCAIAAALPSDVWAIRRHGRGRGGSMHSRWRFASGDVARRAARRRRTANLLTCAGQSGRASSPSERGHFFSARWRSMKRRSAPNIPRRRRASTISPSCCRPRATSPRRGRFTSARWRSARRRSAPSIPTRRRASTISPCCCERGDFAAAQPLYERALAICEKALGAEHANANRIRSNLARLLIALGEPGEALFEACPGDARKGARRRTR